MKRWLLCFALSLLLGCDDPPPSPPPLPPPSPCEDPNMLQAPGCLSPVDPYQGTHPLDAAVHERLLREGIDARPASASELCRRLAADLIGRYLTAAEVESQCAGRPVEEVVDELRSRPEYLTVSRRHWRDRLETSDLYIDWRLVKDLFDRVDALQLGELSYSEFAEQVLGHPAFVLTRDDPVDRVRHAFEAFLGRPATDAEAYDLSALYRPWLRDQSPDPDFAGYRFGAFVVPLLCAPIVNCSARLLGGESVDLEADGAPFQLDPSVPYGRVAYEDLQEPKRQALQAMGRLVVRQPIFWEAAADDLLDRLLGWSDGGRFPRRPGVVLPELRAALADYLRQTGDYAGSEKLVLTSMLYRQTSQRSLSEDDSEGGGEALPVYAYGPLKPALAEVWIDSTANLVRSPGRCDPRYPDSLPYFLIFQAFEAEEISLAQLQESLERLYVLQEHEGSLNQEALAGGLTLPDQEFLEVMRGLGGCPSADQERTASVGLAYAFLQETALEYLCLPENNPAGRPFGVGSLEGILEHQMEAFFGRSPSAEDQADFRSAFESCEAEDCSVDGLTRGICAALLGSAEMLYY